MDSPRPNKRKKIHNDENDEEIIEYQRHNNNICFDDDDDISDSELVRASQMVESKFINTHVSELSEIQNNNIKINNNYYLSDLSSHDVDINKLKADNFQKAGEVKMLREKFKKVEIEMNKLRNEKIELTKKLSKQNDDTEKAFRKQIESKELEIKFKTQEIIEITMKYKSLEAKIKREGNSNIVQQQPLPPPIVNIKKSPINQANDNIIPAIADIKPVLKQEVYVRKMKLKTKLNYNDKNIEQAKNIEINETGSLDYNTYYYQLIDKFKYSLLHFNSLFSNSALVNSEKEKDYLIFEKSLHELNKNINNLLHKVSYSQNLSIINQDKFQISSNLCKKYMNLVLNNLNKIIKSALVVQSNDTTSDLFINISYLLLEILINLSQYEELIYSAKNSDDLMISQFSFNLKHELSLLISQLLKSSNCLNFNTLNCILIVFNQLLSKSDSSYWLQLLHNSENKSSCLFYLFYEKCTKFFNEESYKVSDNSISSKYENRFIFNFLSFFDLYISKLSQTFVFNNSTSYCLCKMDMISSFSCIIDYLTIKKYILADNLKILNNENLSNNYLIYLCKLMQIILLITNNCKIMNDEILFESIRHDYRYKNFNCLILLLLETYLPKKFEYLNFNNIKGFIKSSIENFL
jgi:hypothetical protein